jgi:hypothetical protein
LRQYTAQNEDFPEDPLIHKVKELLETLLKNNNFEGQTKITVDNNREKYTLVREGTSEAEFRQLVKDFNENENEGSLLEDENAHFGIGYLYLNIVPGSYNANMMEGGSRKSRRRKQRKSRKSKSKKSRKSKKSHAKRKY